ncbi:MAG: cupin domain-containing protein [Flavobacteriaceae bacterium]|nr:cupin domain-containing protein [Flavobacteriaceae bacterium]
MNRKTFLTQIGGAGLLTMLPLSSMIASNKFDHNSDKDINEKIVLNKEGKILNVIGDIQTHKLLGSDTNNQIVEWVNEVEPGTGIPPHIHTREDEIFRVIKGQVEIMVGNKTVILNEGDMAYAPKNIVHSWKIVGDKKASMCTSAFPAGIEIMFNELNELPEGPPNFEIVAKICAKYGIRFV